MFHKRTCLRQGPMDIMDTSRISCARCTQGFNAPLLIPLLLYQRKRKIAIETGTTNKGCLFLYYKTSSNFWLIRSIISA